MVIDVNYDVPYSAMVITHPTWRYYLHQCNNTSEDNLIVLFAPRVWKLSHSLADKLLFIYQEVLEVVEGRKNIVKDKLIAIVIGGLLDDELETTRTIPIHC